MTPPGKQIAPAEAKGPELVEYGIVATHPIDLPDGRTGIPGETCQLTAEQAESLLADGHLVPMSETAQSRSTEPLEPKPPTETSAPSPDQTAPASNQTANAEEETAS